MISHKLLGESFTGATGLNRPRGHAPVERDRDAKDDRADGGVLYSTSPNRWSASFMVKTTTVSDRLRSPNFRS
jgi:hypothetical protein